MGDICAAIEIGGSKLQMVAGDALGAIVDRIRCEVVPELGGPGIRKSICDHLLALIQKWRPVALGVGFGGPVDFNTGKICCSHQIEGWSDFPIGPWLAELTGLRVRIENDASTAALGESVLGAGVGFNPVFYVTLGSGVGGGLVHQREIYHGALPGEAEVGHLRLDRNGTTVESRCSGWSVDARIRERVKSGTAAILKELVGTVHGGEARFLDEALNRGDHAGKEIFRELVDDLAFALSHVTHLFHPAVIVLGGGLSLIGEKLREAVERELQRHIMSVFAPGPAIRLARLGEDAVPVGALLLAARLASERAA